MNNSDTYIKELTARVNFLKKELNRLRERLKNDCENGRDVWWLDQITYVKMYLEYYQDELNYYK